MAGDRFKAGLNRRRVQECTQFDHGRRQLAAIRHAVKAEAKALVPKQSVEEFLANGGAIQKVEEGIEGVPKLTSKGRLIYKKKLMYWKANQKRNK